MQESREGRETATRSIEHIVGRRRIKKCTQTDRQAGIIGLLSPRHMPINELFREVRVFLPNQRNQIQNPPPFFFLLPSSTIRAPRHLAPDRSLAGSRKSQTSDA